MYHQILGLDLSKKEGDFRYWQDLRLVWERLWQENSKTAEAFGLPPR